MSKAIVLFSGGQDSTTCLFWALNKYDEVETIGFFYGQRHSVELVCREKILEKLRSKKKNLGKDTLIDISSFGKIASSALTQGGQFEQGSNGLPTSFVPARNLIFLCMAASRAYSIGADSIVTGVCETDYSGYPDCRSNTITAMEDAISFGLDRQIRIETPLMFLTKSQTWELAEQVGGKEAVDFIVRETHTCYEGDHETLHEWGYGCGKCPACILRENGYKKFIELN